MKAEMDHWTCRRPCAWCNSYVVFELQIESLLMKAQMDHWTVMFPEVQPHNVSLHDYVDKTVSLPLSGSWNPNAEADLVKV